MIISDISKLTNKTSAKVLVECDFKKSNKCCGIYKITHHSANKAIKKYNGKIPCKYCSYLLRTEKSNVHKNCIKCNEKFTSGINENQNYCSIECFNSGNKLTKLGKCTFCKDEFNYTSKPKRKNNAFWCPSCVSKNTQIKHKYGISLYDYDDMLSKQDNVCAICKTANKGYRNYLCIDHCHKTGKVRGLLCDNCNNAIGKLEDNTKIMQNAILYLINNNEDNSWDRYFINIASLTASRSKDRSVQVGAVIVKNNTITSTGFNGFPRGCNDQELLKLKRPEKYDWTCHAEENAIINAARNGISTLDSVLYVTPMYPCSKCTRAIIQSGIKKIICQPSIQKDKWSKEFEISKNMLKGANIEFVELN